MIRPALRSHAESPLPRPVSRRGWAVLAGLMLAFAASFAVVLHFYDAEGGLVVTGAAAPTSGAGIRIVVTPLSLDPQTDQLSARFGFEPENLVGLLDSESRLTRPVRITVYGLDGSHEFRYQVGDQLSPQTATLGVAGNLASYPFDHYSGAIWFAAEETTLGADGSTARDKPLPTRVDPRGGLTNWDTTFTLAPGWSTQDTTLVDFTRVFSTRMFALLMLLLMAVLAVVAAVIAALAVTHRRRAEMGMLSWLAGLLFAFPALRHSLPDAPPIGVTIDMVIFLWTLLLALISAVLMAAAWGVQSRAALLAQARSEEDVAAET